METRANYVLIGAFTLAGFLGLLVFFLWFAQVELDRQFDYYDIEFESVSGLTNASEVRFSGLLVGKVIGVALSPDGDGLIRVRLEISADTPVRTSSEATIESQGVTGLSYVGISSGRPDDPLLQPGEDGEIPRIKAGRSVLQALSEDAPTIVEEALRVVEQINTLLGDENQKRVAAILINVDSASAELSQALRDFSKVTDTVATATEELAAFTARLDTISNTAVSTLEAAERTLGQVGDLADRAQDTLAVGETALASGSRSLDAVEGFVTNDLPRLVTQVEETTAAVREQLTAVGGEAQAMLAEFRNTGAVATERLTEAADTLRAADQALVSVNDTLGTVDSVAANIDTLITGDGAGLVAEARALLQDLGQLSATAETALQSADATMADLRGLSMRAQTTLDAGDAALGSGQQTLEAVRGFVEEQLPVAMSELQATTTQARAQLSVLGEAAAGLIDEYRATGAVATERLTEAGQTLKAADESLAALTQALGSVDTVAANLDTLLTGEGTALITDARSLMAEAQRLAGSATSTLREVDTTLATVQELTLRAQVSLTTGDAMLVSGRNTLEAVRSFVTDDLPGAMADLEATTTLARSQLSVLGEGATRLIAEYTATGSVATERLTEAAQTLKAADETLAALTKALGTVDSAAATLDTLLNEDGAALVADARRVLNDADRVILSAAQVAERDLPAIVADIRSATATASRVVEQVGTDLSSATGRIDAVSADAQTALTTVTETFVNANETLTRLNTALETGDSALAAADRAFTSADAVLSGDVTAIAAEVRATLARIDGAVAQVSEDLPQISQALRDTAERAETTLEQVRRSVVAVAGPAGTFAAEGLPQYTRLAKEARDLVTALDRLVGQLQRDPARTLLGRDVPEFRR